MHNISEQLFLVDGKESRLTIESDYIVWRSVGHQHDANSSNINNDKSSSSSATASRHDNSKNLSPTKGAPANRLSFAQIIGTANQHCSSSIGTPVVPVGASATGNTYKRFKLYYAKDNVVKSTIKLLKIKSLTIESVQSSVHGGSSSSTTKSLSETLVTKNNELTAAGAARGELAQLETKTGEQCDQHSSDASRAASEPPSCYVSEGSTSHLSSLSACSSSATAPTAAEAQVVAAAVGQSFREGDQDRRPATLAELSSLIEARLEAERRQANRPRRLLVFVNPFGGKGKAVRLFKSKVRRLLAIANVETKLVITKHANHARETIEDPAFKVEHFDAIICIGGDGMFSELMNGLLFRYNREKILAAATTIKPSLLPANGGSTDHADYADQQLELHVNNCSSDSSSSSAGDLRSDNSDDVQRQRQSNNDNHVAMTKRRGAPDLESLREALGGIGQPLVSPPLPIGVIGAGSTDANAFGLLGTNDVVTATLNIILGKQISIDVCSVHSVEEDRLLRFVSTFVAYGYFGDVVRESEKLRWLGPSRYDVTGVNNLIKNRAYQGRVRILVSAQDGSPKDPKRCHSNCDWCSQFRDPSPASSELRFIERQGSFVGVNAAVTACRCPQTKKGFSPNNHLANGCVDLILVQPCSRMQYVQYLLRTGYTKKSAFDLKYVEAFRCRQFEFLSLQQDGPRPLDLTSNVSSSSSSAISSSSGSANSNSNSSSLSSGKQQTNGGSGTKASEIQVSASKSLFSSWNVDGEIMDEASIRVKVNTRLLRVFGTGEPNLGAATHIE